MLWLTGKFIKEGIYTPSITPIPTVYKQKLLITLRPSPIPSRRTTRRSKLTPAECLTQMILLQIVDDDMMDEKKCGTIAMVFEDWSIIGN